LPILDVQLVGPVPEDVRRGLAQRIADAAAGVFASRPHGTWVKLHFIDASAYAENEGGPPPGAQPVIVSVLQAEPPSAGALEDQVGRLSRVIAEACTRPVASVHLIYEAPGKGRVAFGGRLLV
jgi:phenylpyruvate tautomerase PptA (4-oxalocrotonate tautomerase family)